MTPTQQKLINHFEKNLVSEIYSEKFAHNYEIKEFEVKKNYGGTQMVVMEVGRIGDEGTAASIFCRDRKIIFIGKRGGVKAYNSKNQKFETVKLFQVFSPGNLG